MRCYKCNVEIDNPWHTLDCQAVMLNVPEHYKDKISIVQHNGAKFALEQRGKFNNIPRVERHYEKNK